MSNVYLPVAPARGAMSAFLASAASEKEAAAGVPLTGIRGGWFGKHLFSFIANSEDDHTILIPVFDTQHRAPHPALLPTLSQSPHLEECHIRFYAKRG